MLGLLLVRSKRRWVVGEDGQLERAVLSSLVSCK